MMMMMIKPLCIYGLSEVYSDALYQ